MAGETLDIDQFFDHGHEGTPSKKSKRTMKKEARQASNKAQKERRHPRPVGPLVPRSPEQAAYIESLRSNTLSFGIGTFGAGKTYLPSRVFGEMLASGEIEKIYVTRPNVAKKQHKNGYLPGDLKDKTEPWLVPVFEGLKDSLGPKAFGKARAEGKIEEVPMEFIQGRTFKNAACIVDEAENLDFDDFYIILGRQGENLHMALAGDIKQSRIPNSGLAEIVEMAQWPEMRGIGIVTFDSDCVVRSDQAKQWAKAFEKRERLQKRVQGFGNPAPAFMSA